MTAPEEPLRGRAAVGSLDVEVVDNRQCGELVGQESVHAVMEQGQVAVAAFDTRARALECIGALLRHFDDERATPLV